MFNPPTPFGGTSTSSDHFPVTAASNLSVKKKDALTLSVSFLISKVFSECAYNSAVLESIHLRTCQLCHDWPARSSGGSFSFFFSLAIERSSGANVAALDSSAPGGLAENHRPLASSQPTIPGPPRRRRRDRCHSGHCVRSPTLCRSASRSAQPSDGVHRPSIELSSERSAHREMDI